MAILSLIFSNSSIIHKKKTKKITTLTVVWITDTNYQKFCKLYLQISPRIIVQLRSYIQNSTQCFIRYPDTSKSVLKKPAAPCFSSHFSVSGYRMKHCVLFWIYYIHKHLSYLSGIRNCPKTGMSAQVFNAC